MVGAPADTGIMKFSFILLIDSVEVASLPLVVAFRRRMPRFLNPVLFIVLAPLHATRGLISRIKHA